MLFIWVIIAGVLQATVLRDLNLLLLLAVFGGLRRGAVFGLLLGLFIGGFLGVFSVFDFVLGISLYGFVGLLSGLVKLRVVYKEDFLMQIMFSLCGLFVFYAAYFILTDTFQFSVVYTVMFSALISPFLFRIVER